MQLQAIVRILGLLIMIFSSSMLFPALVAIIYKDGAGSAFMVAFAVSLGICFILWFFTQRQKAELRAKEGFLIVVLFWTVLGSIGALPFLFSEQPVVDAMQHFPAVVLTGCKIDIGKIAKER